MKRVCKNERIYNICIGKIKCLSYEHHTGEPSEALNQNFVVASDDGWDDVIDEWTMTSASSDLQPSGYICETKGNISTSFCY